MVNFSCWGLTCLSKQWAGAWCPHQVIDLIVKLILTPCGKRVHKMGPSMEKLYFLSSLTPLHKSLSALPTPTISDSRENQSLRRQIISFAQLPCTVDVGATLAADKWAVSSWWSNFLFESFFRSYQLKIQFLAVQRWQESPGFARKAVPGVACPGHRWCHSPFPDPVRHWEVGGYKPATREIWLQFQSHHWLAVSSFSKWL